MCFWGSTDREEGKKRLPMLEIELIERDIHGVFGMGKGGFGKDV